MLTISSGTCGIVHAVSISARCFLHGALRRTRERRRTLLRNHQRIPNNKAENADYHCLPR